MAFGFIGCWRTYNSFKYKWRSICGENVGSDGAVGSRENVSVTGKSIKLQKTNDPIRSDVTFSSRFWEEFYQWLGTKFFAEKSLAIAVQVAKEKQLLLLVKMIDFTQN